MKENRSIFQEKATMNEPWIIKFGEKEHLEQLLDGKILFHTLSYFRNYEEKEMKKVGRIILRERQK